MNQILSVDKRNVNKKRKKPKNNSYNNSGQIEIKKITMFFAIAMIVFGVFMIGSASYAMIKNDNSSKS